MSQAGTQEFGKWRSRLWPIHNYELKKLVPMIFMFFLILFNYTVLRDSKDALLVCECGNLAIPVVKIFGTSLAAIFFLVIYSKMSNMMSKPKLFYSTIIPFIAFFALFGLVIYPNAHHLELTGLGGWLRNALPSSAGFQAIADCVQKWPYPVFYVMAEMWGTVGISLLFWGFANDVTRVSEAKRVYPVLPLMGNAGLLLAGPTVKFFSWLAGRGDLSAQAASELSTLYLMGVLVISGITIVTLYWYLNNRVLNDPRFCPEGDAKMKKKEKPKMGLMESFRYLASSKYLLCLAMLVIGYGMAINLIEVTWKGQLKMYFPEKNDYLGFMGVFSGITGLVSMLCMVFVGGNVMRRFGWTSAALFTPVMLLVTGLAFFSFIIFQDSFSSWFGLGAAQVLFLAVIIGAAQNILSKASKYSLFDPTKEMAYIPLDQEQKVKGKAAIDVAGARLGKSGGAALQLTLSFFVSAAVMVPIVGLLAIGIVLIWLSSAKSLGRQFTALSQERAAEAAAQEASTETAPAGA